MRESLIERERGFWDAAGDGSFYEENMDPGGCCLLPVGRLDRDATVAAIAEAEPWSEVQLDDVELMEPAAEVAVLSYRATARRGGGEPYVALISTTYVRREETWALLLHQQTPVEPGA